jgi:hypothetical protein
MTDIDAQLTAIDRSLQSVDPPRQASQHRRHLRTVARRRFARLDQRKSAVELLSPLPGPGESLHLAIPATFSGWNLIAACIDLLAAPCDEVILSTLGFNDENAADLISYLDNGTIKSVTLHVSHYFRHSDKDIFSRIRTALESRGQKVQVSRCHAKLALIRSGDRNLVIETSANLRSSQNWEQATVCDDAGLLAFHRNWLSDLLEATV